MWASLNQFRPVLDNFWVKNYARKVFFIVVHFCSFAILFYCCIFCFDLFPSDPSVFNRHH